MRSADILNIIRSPSDHVDKEKWDHGGMTICVEYNLVAEGRSRSSNIRHAFFKSKPGIYTPAVDKSKCRHHTN